MAEKGSREPASTRTALENMEEIWRERGFDPPITPGLNISRRLREELESKGLKGFKRGGKVKKTGVAKVHRGERIVSAAQAQKPAVKAALKQWREYLLDRRNDVRPFSQHLLVVFDEQTGLHKGLGGEISPDGDLLCRTSARCSW